MQGVAVKGVLPGQLVVSDVLNTPVPLKALESHTYGVRPAKTPTPPRSWSLPLGLQLKPMRGEITMSSFGVAEVLKPRALCTTGLKSGLSGKLGLSPRRPKVRVRRSLTRHWSPA